MEKARYLRIVKIDTDCFQKAEETVNQAINELTENGCKVVTIIPLSSPCYMYNIIYEKAIGAVKCSEQKKQETPKTAEQPVKKAEKKSCCCKCQGEKHTESGDTHEPCTDTPSVTESDDKGKDTADQ